MKCPICGGDRFVYNYERGEVVCAACGAVVQELMLDLGPEWRAFTSEEEGQRARTGAPLTRLTSEALTTVIDWRGRDAFGKELDIKTKLKMIRLWKWQNKARVQTSYERNLAEAAQELERLKSSMGVPRPCVEQAMKTIEAILINMRGCGVAAIAAAALYIACRIMKTPRQLNELVKYAKASRREVARCYRRMLKELNIKAPIGDPILYVPKIAGQLKLSGEVVKTAIDILQRAKKVGVRGTPAGIAAAAVYIASLLHGDSKTQKEAAKAAGVTEVTVRNHYKKLVKTLNIKFV